MTDGLIVIKVGSMALVNDRGDGVDYNVISQLSKDLNEHTILVTSGAAVVGKLDYIKRNGHALPENDSFYKSDYASQGQTILMNLYREFMNPKYSLRQVLVEHQHFNDVDKRQHLLGLLERCAQQNAVPIVNYNDCISSEECRKMEINLLREKNQDVVECIDNDETATRIAVLTHAKKLLLLTMLEGIFINKDDPSILVKELSSNNRDELIAKITDLQSHCEGASRQGANGAFAKLEYAKFAVQNGIDVIIASSKYRINDILANKVPNTHIFVK